MNFIEAIRLLRNGDADNIIRPSWDKIKIVRRKASKGFILVDKETETIEYNITMDDVLAIDWMAGVKTFGFDKAITLLKEGSIVRRIGWEADTGIFLSEDSLYTYKVGRLDSRYGLPEEDILADDWCLSKFPKY